ncbi:Heat shock transcription factor [Malassezia nana]|uniref:Heat shock transcription factor n=1 Tax=Malassezia nana TaxID=180528 RepID=A0AAF0J1F2_9BASI|nr:Heat shock transcription factor [Malassezia nana]
MVDDPNTDELIRWSPDGDSFLVPNHVRFGDEVLPRFFKHKNFSSFVRQLNMYGFHKVPHLQQGALKTDQPSQSELWEFSNPCFQRDHPDLLFKVQRKRSGKERENNNAQVTEEATRTLNAINAGALTRGDYDLINGDTQDLTKAMSSVQLAGLINAIQGIKSNQHTIIEEISKLQHSSQALWQQGMENRQQVRRQQDTINRILRFLASVFGSSNVGDMLQTANGVDLGNLSSLDADFHAQEQPRFEEHDTIHVNGKGQKPMRPQKRARLLISDQAYADQMADTMNVDTDSSMPPSNEQRFTEASNETDDNSPARWSQVPTEMPSPTINPVASPDAPSPNNAQALSYPEGQAWLSTLLNHHTQGTNGQSLTDTSRVNPQLLATLQQLMSQSPSSADSSSNAPNPQSLMSPDANQGANTPINNALLASMLTQWRPDSPARSNHAMLDRVKPEERLVQDVERLSNDAKMSMEHTHQLQNQINKLVQNLRLSTSDTQQANPTGKLPIPTEENARRPEWPAMSAPSAYVPSSPSTQVPGLPPQSPSPGTGSGGEFDLDSFLNQFVDPMNTPNASFGTSPMPMSEESVDAMGEGTAKAHDHSKKQEYAVP